MTLLMLLCSAVGPHPRLRAATVGTPYGWGATDNASFPPDATNIVAIDASLFGTIALRADGTVLAWDGSPQPPTSLSNVVAISAGGVHHAALKSDGQVVIWGGFHVAGEAIRNPPARLTNAVAISAGYDHTVALTATGELIAWGANALGVLTVPSRTFSPRSFAAGQQTVVVVEPDGRLFGWGTSIDGILSFPSSATNVVQVDMGPYMHGVALREDGTVRAWGSNTEGQATVPSGLSNVVQVAAGAQSSIALRTDGSVVIWGQPNTPWSSPPPDPIRFFAISSGNNRHLGLTRAPVPRGGPDGGSAPAGRPFVITRPFIGSDPYTVQWMRNGIDLPGETNATLVFPNLQAPQAGQYVARASNEFGTSTNAPFFLGVLPAPPQIGTQPEHQAVPVGGEIRLSVVVAGSEPFSFQWLRSGTPVLGATNSSLVIRDATDANDGDYTVTISNDLGTITSTPATVSTGRPRFSSQPRSFRGLRNRPWRLEAAVVTPESPSLAWYLGTNRVADAIGPVLDLPQVTASVEGEYRLVASNSFGMSTSVVAHVTVRTPPAPLPEPMIAVHAESEMARPESFNQVLEAAMSSISLPFAVGLQADGTLIQWNHSNDPARPFRPPENLTNVVALATGIHHALALSADGRVRSWLDPFGTDHGQAQVPPDLDRVVEIAAANQFNLALQDDGVPVSWPMGGSLPGNLTGVAAISANQNHAAALLEDGTVLFWDQYRPDSAAVFRSMDVVSITTGPFFVGALLRDGSLRFLFPDGSGSDLPPVPGNGRTVEIATSHNQLLARTDGGRVFARPRDAAGWSEWIPGLRGVERIRSGIGSALAFTRVPFIYRPPVSQNFFRGQMSFLEVSFSAPPRTAIQWLRDDRPLEGATNSILTFESAFYTDKGLYSVVLSTDRLSITSAPAAIDVVGPVAFEDLFPQTILAGDDLLIEPTFLGPAPSQYRWYFNFNPVAIPNATGPTLLIPNAQSVHQGEYFVSVVNAHGPSSSLPVSIRVEPSRPRVTSPAQEQSIAEGDTGSIEFTARGSFPMTVQWYRDGVALEGETNTVLHIVQARPSDAGRWTLVARNALGSAEASIDLVVPPSRPVIRDQVTWRMANAGNPFSLSPRVLGSEPLFLQWKRNGTDIPGETNRSLSFANLTTNDADLYSLYLSNHLGEAISDPMRLVVRPGNGPGALVAWGSASIPPELGVIQEVALGTSHGVALLPDGTVFSWPGSTFAEIRTPTDLRDVVSVAAGANFNLALRADGSLRAWGRPDGGSLNIPSGLQRVVAIAASGQYAVALQENGIPVTWGTVSSGRTNVPTTATDVISISTRSGHILGLRRNGTAVSWGPTAPVNIPASVSNLVAISAVQRGGIGLRSDRRLVVWGTAPVPPINTEDVVQLSAGGSHAVAVRSNGSLLAWGSNARGQSSIPNGLTNIVSISTGSEASLALTRSPVIRAAATSIIVQPGEPAEVTAFVHGLEPLTFQWMRDGILLDGATNRSLRLDSILPGDAARYSLIASNPWLTVTGSPIDLRVVGPIQLEWVPYTPTGWALWVRAQGATSITLQQSVDLGEWTTLLTTPVSDDGTVLPVIPGPEPSTQFYRVRIP